MGWIDDLFETTRRTPDEFAQDVEVLDRLVGQLAGDYDPEDVVFLVDADAADDFERGLQLAAWVEGEPEHPQGWSYVSPVGVEGRALMATLAPLASGPRLYLSVVDVGDDWDHLRTGQRGEDDSVLVLVGDQELEVPALTGARTERHGDEYPVGGYGPGDELELDTTDGWIPARFLSRVYPIPEENFGRFVERLEKMAKKAAQLGAPAPTWREVGRYLEDQRTVEEVRDGDPPYFRTVYRVVVTGEGPSLEGWKFIGTIDPGEGELAAGHYLLRMVPGESIPERFKVFEDVDPRWCDYCRTRRRRVKTFIVENVETGDSVQVGSNCIRDFLGHVSPQSIAAYLQWLSSPADDLEDDGLGGGGYMVPMYDLELFLAYTNRAITQDGWMSRGRAKSLSFGGRETMATADYVLWALFPSHKLRNEAEKAEQASFRRSVTDSDYEAARAALEWAPELWTPTADYVPTDYGVNMEAALSSGLVSHKTAGLVASLVAAHQRHLERLLERKLREEVGRGSEHVGAVGQRVKIPALTVTDVKSFENEWGETQLIKMLTDDGNLLAWWYGGMDEFHVGGRYGGACTIKKHGEFKGKKETTVQRCVLAPLDRLLLKVTPKQAEELLAAGVPEDRLYGDADDPDLALLPRDLLYANQAGATQLADAVLPGLSKALRKKILTAVAATDLEL